LSLDNHYIHNYTYKNTKIFYSWIEINTQIRKLKTLSNMLKAKTGVLRKVKGKAPMPGDGYIAPPGLNPVVVANDASQASGALPKARVITPDNYRGWLIGA